MTDIDIATESNLDENGLPALLGPADPPPFETVNPDGAAPLLLTCEHAGRAVPASLGDLGVPAAEFERHIAWDIGAETVARALSAALDAPLAIQPYSRLAVDCNRPFKAETSIPPVSDGTVIPGNADLDPALKRQRFAEIHQPFHNEVARLLDRALAAGAPVNLIAVHSFTPRLRTEGRDRPWHLGLLYNRDDRLAQRLMRIVRDGWPDLNVACNEPYTVNDENDYTIPVHGEGRGVPHVLLEIRQDLIATPDGQARWAGIVTAAIQRLLAEPDAG